MEARIGRQLRILVVDDEPLVCETICMLLEVDGHDVSASPSAEKALSVFEPDKFDVVVTDYFMPGMTGGELAVAIKGRSPNQPIVLLTGQAERFKPPNPPLIGVDLIIEKPVPQASLREALRRLVPAKDPDSIRTNERLAIEVR